MSLLDFYDGLRVHFPCYCLTVPFHMSLYKESGNSRFAYCFSSSICMGAVSMSEGVDQTDFKVAKMGFKTKSI